MPIMTRLGGVWAASFGLLAVTAAAAQDSKANAGAKPPETAEPVKFPSSTVSLSEEIARTSKEIESLELRQSLLRGHHSQVQAQHAQLDQIPRAVQAPA